ncbi:MAG TPA: VOC family protein [Streptosporangiaceae bacterium]|nr:VOC family protein [Streptosporangiaceae bacterium]
MASKTRRGIAGRHGGRRLAERRIEMVEAKVAELIRLGASVERRTQHDNPEDPIYYVVMHDPEGNEFCVS